MDVWYKIKTQQIESLNPLNDEEFKTLITISYKQTTINNIEIYKLLLISPHTFENWLNGEFFPSPTVRILVRHYILKSIKSLT
ncbi:MAG: hypothetical protein GY714_01940 [Desulfobacterales bacterium]|nr:hypothetical protein [Desulfobacterales bacterium]